VEGEEWLEAKAQLASGECKAGGGKKGGQDVHQRARVRLPLLPVLKHAPAGRQSPVVVLRWRGELPGAARSPPILHPLHTRTVPQSQLALGRYTQREVATSAHEFIPPTSHTPGGGCVSRRLQNESRDVIVEGTRFELGVG